MRNLQLTAFCIAVLSACLWAASDMNFRLEKINIEGKIKTMASKSVCVGRFVVEVPSQMVVTYRKAIVAAWKISTTVETDEEFQARMWQKENLLASSRNQLNGVSLELAQKIRTDHVIGKIFLYGRNWIGLMRGGKEVISEAVSIDALVRASGVSYDFTGELRKPEDVQRLEKLLQQLQPLREGEVPASAGFCFDRGVLRDPLTIDDHEHVSIFFGTKEQPDLAGSLSTFAGTNPGRTLLQRHAASDIQREYKSHFHDLRVGARVINGIRGEEVLQRVDEFNGVKLHDFMWESISDAKDVLLPALTLELSTGLGRPGKPINSGLSDAEALALWDALSSNLRRRHER